MGTMLANRWTTIIGVALAALYYLQGVGTKLPATGGEWLQFAVGLGIVALGVVSKDALTGSRP